MTLEEFAKSDPLTHEAALRALWFALQGKWDAAHDIAQSDDSREGAWVHAYLHRVEGDTTNANYWYERAGRATEQADLEGVMKLQG